MENLHEIIFEMAGMRADSHSKPISAQRNDLAVKGIGFTACLSATTILDNTKQYGKQMKNEIVDWGSESGTSRETPLGDNGQFLEKVEKENEVGDTSEAKESSYLAPPATTGQKVAMLTAVTLPFLGCLAAIALLWQYGWMGWPYLAMVIAGWVITASGVTVGFHRLLSHRSFETYNWVKTTWAMIGALSVQGNPLVWCAVHRRHHERSDKVGDPHSPNLHGFGIRGMLKGLWHGQVGWLFSGFWSYPDLKRYIPDLTKQKSLVVVGNCYFLFVLIGLAIPTAIGFWIDGAFGAFLGFIWGGLVRVFLTHHITWSINSICHVFGQRPYESGDLSTNNFVCGVLALGEGWHNNHHAFPSLARFGFRWWQFDFSWWIIQAMRACGLAWNVKTPSPGLLASKER